MYANRQEYYFGIKCLLILITFSTYVFMIAFCLFENIKHIYPAVPLNLDDLKWAAAELAGGNELINCCIILLN